MRALLRIVSALLFWACLPARAGQPYIPPSLTAHEPQPPFESTLEIVEIEGDDIGGKRSAYVHVPSGPGPWPVIFAFHGGRNNNGLDMAPRLESARGENVLLVFPNGTLTDTAKGPKEGGWTGPDHEEEEDSLRDVNFVRELIDDLDRRYDVDRKRVYAVGFSAGAYLTEWLWCQASDEIRGFFFVSRAMPVMMADQCPAKPLRPVGLMLGTADDGLVNARQMSFVDSQTFIADKLDCHDSPTTETLPDKPDNTTVKHTTWSDCGRGTTFEYWEIDGGGHNWPGQVHKGAAADRSLDVDATAELLRFFRQNGGL